MLQLDVFSLECVMFDGHRDFTLLQFTDDAVLLVLGMCIVSCEYCIVLCIVVYCVMCYIIMYIVVLYCLLLY